MAHQSPTQFGESIAASTTPPVSTTPLQSAVAAPSALAVATEAPTATAAEAAAAADTALRQAVVASDAATAAATAAAAAADTALQKAIEVQTTGMMEENTGVSMTVVSQANTRNTVELPERDGQGRPSIKRLTNASGAPFSTAVAPDLRELPCLHGGSTSSLFQQEEDFQTVDLTNAVTDGPVHTPWEQIVKDTRRRKSVTISDQPLDLPRSLSPTRMALEQ